MVNGVLQIGSVETAAFIAGNGGCGRHARTPSARVDPTARGRRLLFAEHPGRGFGCLRILDNRIQFNINQVTPIVHMLGEGGHIVGFQDVPAQNRPGHVIPSNLLHSLGRRTAGFQELLKCRLVKAGARSPRKHEFHGDTLLVHLRCGADVATCTPRLASRLTSLSHQSCLVAFV